MASPLRDKVGHTLAEEDAKFGMAQLATGVLVGHPPAEFHNGARAADDNNNDYDDDNNDDPPPLVNFNAVPNAVPTVVLQLNDAAEEGSLHRVVALLDQGVAVDSRDVHQWTPLHGASRRGRRAVASLLVDRGGNVNAESISGVTPAICASCGGHLDTLQLLVSRGADIHHRDHDGESSLSSAAQFDRLPVCEYLLSLGVDLMAPSNKNQTVLNTYGRSARPRLSPATTALRCAALEAAWAAGPHPSQVQRRRDERWFRRGPLLWVLAEHGYRPLQLRALAIALAAAELDPAAPIEAVALTTKEQRHAFLLGRIFSCEDIVRLLVALL